MNYLNSENDLGAPAEPSTDEASTPYSILSDASNPRWLIPLNGWFERNGFSPTLMVLLVLVFGFVAFQVLGAVVAIVLVLVREGSGVLEDPGMLLQGQTDLLLWGNTVGQALGLALPVLVVAGLHARPRWAFLRLRSPDFRQVFYAIVGLLLLLPFVQWLSYVNSMVPLPDALAEFERQQIEFLERVLSGETGIVLNIFALAITPAICEELFFRGYIHRQIERSGGVVAAIVVTGVIFGSYHLRFSQILPLTLLGFYLGYVTWRTGSLWPAVVLHLVNNGLALALSAYFETNPSLGIDSVDTMPVPMYIVVPGILFFAMLAHAMNRDAVERLGFAKVRRNGKETNDSTTGTI